MEVIKTNEKLKSNNNKCRRMLHKTGVYFLKSINVVIAFAVSIITFTVAVTVAMLVGAVYGIASSVSEVITNLKDLKNKLFVKNDNMIDEYYKMQKMEELQTSMEISKEVQNYLVFNELKGKYKAIGKPQERLKISLQNISKDGKALNIIKDM